MTVTDVWFVVGGGLALTLVIALLCWNFFVIGRNVGRREAWRVVTIARGRLKTPFGTVRVMDA